ncbi:MAG TPA: hypothetical protein VGN72_13820 [Tepidisphaeraceae bacterium]|jgi:tetratricopeptide (TPR) repeat protein|nr:hypothetical protein [Tepidisphaeraceae bacterium]
MLRRVILSGTAMMLAASVLVAKPGVVKTPDGATFQGDVTTDERSVTITNKSGIETKLDRRNVASIEYLASPAEEFQQRMSQLKPDDVEGRIQLARWAYDNRQYAQARDALDAALKIDPNNRDATDLLETVQRQVRLERSTGNNGNAGNPAPGAGQPAAAPAGGAGGGNAEPAAEAPPEPPQREGEKFLSPEQVNAIRQFEWNRNDTRVRARLKGDVKKRYVDYTAGNLRDFNAMNVIDQAWEILTKGTPEMRKDVEILTDPASMMEFRRPNVQGKILAGCATAGCHGTAGAGGFQLYTAGDNEAVAYTNFYILQKYRQSVDGVERKMIDRANPESSLLIQYGLPADLAETDHPAVGTYNGIFRNRSDATYNAIKSWMGQSLALIQPSYGIDFTPPSTQPATTAPADAGQ